MSQIFLFFFSISLIKWRRWTQPLKLCIETCSDFEAYLSPPPPPPLSILLRSAFRYLHHFLKIVFFLIQPIPCSFNSPLQSNTHNALKFVFALIYRKIADYFVRRSYLLLFCVIFLLYYFLRRNKIHILFDPVTFSVIFCVACVQLVFCYFNMEEHTHTHKQRNRERKRH